MSPDTALSDDVLALLGYLTLTYSGDGTFTVGNVVPAWAVRFPQLSASRSVHLLELLDLFPVLDAAVTDLDTLWLGTHDSPRHLGEWADVDDSGHELHLSAHALSVRSVRVIVLSPIHRQLIDLIRRARETIRRNTGAQE